VNGAADVKCPEDYATCDWGTVAFPYHDLGQAIDRASPLTTALVQGGEYRVAERGPRVIDHPLVIKAGGGGVVVLR
jgi:hypothetical protein